MPKLPLTIKKTYLPSWGAFEGVREVIQNARDAVTEFGGTMDAWHVPGKDGEPDRLFVENVGAVLSREALLLGQTSKEGRKDMIGHFGEGLKLGVLALVRAGHHVKIRTGAEVWTPSFERSEQFDADVLTFDIATGREPKVRVRVEIDQISAEDWARFKQCFLFLQERKGDDSVETTSGTLLLAPRMVGKVFVKGIFVQHDSSLSYGYDLAEVTVDRDRKLVASYDLQRALRSIWVLALGQRPELNDKFVTILDRGKADVQGLASWNVDLLPVETVTAVAKGFLDKHGEALPVQSLAESRELGHLGVKGVVVSEQLSAVLQRALGNTDTKKAQLKIARTKIYSWHVLGSTEQTALLGALDVLAAIAPGDATLDNVEVVAFGDKGLRGLWDVETKRISLAREVLTDTASCLRTLIHEVAHKRTSAPDGDKVHMQEIERLWMAAFATQWRVA